MAFSSTLLLVGSSVGKHWFITMHLSIWRQLVGYRKGYLKTFPVYFWSLFAANSNKFGEVWINRGICCHTISQNAHFNKNNTHKAAKTLNFSICKIVKELFKFFCLKITLYLSKIPKNSVFFYVTTIISSFNSHKK